MTTATSTDVAHAMREVTLTYLSQMATLFVGGRPRGVPLETFNLYMQTLSRDDALISEAVASMLAHGLFVLDAARNVVIPDA